jgi:cytochrome c-type biogenesis protein
MEYISLGLIISSFFAGLLTFLAPCTLPLVPAYLGFISGVSEKDFQDPLKAKTARRKIFLNGIFFILGFAVVFIIFGTLAGLIGQSLTPFRIWLTRIGGGLVILFGLFMLGVFRLPFLQAERRIKTPSFLTIGKPSSSFAIGGAFAFGWTPCVGPILGSILLLASTSTTAFQGALLLTVFSSGLAVPFILVALGYSHATKYIQKISRYIKWVSIVGGVFLIMLGLLLVTNNFSLLIQYGFELLDFIGYEGLLEFL